MSNMEKNLRLLNKIQKLIPIEKFYSVRLDNDIITLQGEFDQDFMIYLTRWFRFKADDGAIRSNTRNHIKIVFL